MSEHLHTAVLYHANCPDGFGAAYAAWKKFGDTAEYIPVKHGHDIPEHMNGREVFLLDFTYPQAEMDNLKNRAASVTVLDHHEGVRAIATTFPGVFDTDRSGATIAWSYFHPNTPIPGLLKNLEDGDLYHYTLPDTRDLFSLLEVYPREFTDWDVLITQLEDAAQRVDVLAKARTYTEYFEHLGANAAAGAKKIRFAGHECYFANAHPSISMRSYVANLLYTKLPPIALVVSAHPEGLGVSLRSDGSVDVAKIAQQYGGSGHPGSAGFALNWGDPLPWEIIDEE